MAERDPHIIGPRIAKARQARGLTQIELADALGVSPSSVADWERGTSYPKRKLGKIEEFFGQRLDYDEPGAVRSSATATEAIEHLQRALDMLREQHPESPGKGSNGDEGNGTRRAS